MSRYDITERSSQGEEEPMGAFVRRDVLRLGASAGPPGKDPRATRSLTIATLGAPAVSRAVNSRPASSGIPIVWK